MPAYNIPRDTGGEGKILYIFSTKALLYTFIGALIGGLFYFIFNLIGLGVVGIVIIVIFAFIGFAIATFKIPTIRTIPVTEKIGGEKVDEIIKRYIKFKTRKTKTYTLYTKEEERNG